ncbi:oligosaccharide flippase family protein [Spongisporangium articulatum]|uniref:Oligosaccharide flippase family protein n=1 Tax=Spongisporangium articulatum TaxID=3362603 RepID=A0ABW8AT66_9ACTN
MNRLIYLSTVAVQALVSLVLLPVLTHNLPKEQFGTITLVATSQQLATMALGLGTPQLISRFQVLSRSVAHGFGTCMALLTIAGLGLVALLHDPESVIVPLATGNAIIALSLSRLRAQDRALPWAALSIGAGPVAQCTGAALVVLGAGLSGYLGAWLGVVLAVTLLSLVWADRAWFVRPTGAALRHLVRLGGPLSLSAVALVAFTSGDRIVVAQVINHEAAGQYQAFYTLGNLSSFATTALFSYWMPRLLMGRSPARFRLEIAVLALGGAIASVVASFVLLPGSYHPAEHWPIAVIAALSAIPYGLTLEFECRYVRALATARFGSITTVGALLSIAATALVARTTGDLQLVALMTPVTYLILAAVLHLAARGLPVEPPADPTESLAEELIPA